MDAKTLYLGSHKIKVWSDKQQIFPLDEPSISVTDFPDAEHYHAKLGDKILQLAENSEFKDWIFKGGCGTKIRHIDRWSSVEADLIHARAIEFFKQKLNTNTAVVDDCWASVYRKGDYCMPHSHLRATASLVYLLDAGDPDPADAMSGKLCFADPRIPACCDREPGRMTYLLVPDLRPGSMIIFPGSVVHFVNPYNGERPRITLSWNINPHMLPGLPSDGWKKVINTTAANSEAGLLVDK